MGLGRRESSSKNFLYHLLGFVPVHFWTEIELSFAANFSCNHGQNFFHTPFFIFYLFTISYGQPRGMSYDIWWKDLLNINFLMR